MSVFGWCLINYNYETEYFSKDSLLKAKARIKTKI